MSEDTGVKQQKQEKEEASEEIVEVAPGILRLQLPIDFTGLGHVNCYALLDERGVTLVDPGLPGEASWNSLLTRLAAWPRNRVAIAGGFIKGFDSELEGLYTLESDETLEAFDLDAWVLECLSAEKSPPYLPNAQALWFYVHEYYAARPAFVARLIDADRAWIAMMCATEIDGRVAGMRPVLERLVRDPDPDISAHARRQLERFY